MSELLQRRSTDSPRLRAAVRRPIAALPERFAPWHTWRLATHTALAGILLLVSAPVLLVVAGLIKLTSPGPVLYSQTRLGLRGRRFRIYKFRTMWHDCERVSGPCWSGPGDPRVTPVGRFLRWSHLDELPQLWNVLRGEMNLVGPRPERPEFLPQLEQALPHYRRRLAVRPGITGLAQVQLPPDTDINSVRRKLAYDLYYVQHAGLLLDLRLLVCTALAALGIPFSRLQMALGIPGAAAVERHIAIRRPHASFLARLEAVT